MRVLIFGATGMVGQGVLRECLQDPGVEFVQTVGRSTAAVQHPKLRQVIQEDSWDYKAIEGELRVFDACFFCLGVTSAGMNEFDYTRITWGIATAAAETLSRLNPGMTFIFVSGVGADSSERSRTMWARVKGKTENAILRLPFRAAYVFRPGFIQPLHGIRSRTAVYRALYKLLTPVMPLLRKAFPNQILTTEEIGRAMLQVARRGAPKEVLEPPDIRKIVSSI